MRSHGFARALADLSELPHVPAAARSHARRFTVERAAQAYLDVFAEVMGAGPVAAQNNWPVGGAVLTTP